MENIYTILLAGLGVSLTSITGLLIIKSHPKVASFINKKLRTLTAISAGVFLVTSFVLINETLEILSLAHSLLVFAAGLVLYTILHKVLSPHRHMGQDHTHDHKKSAWKILIGDALHNVADGLLLVASFGVSSLVGINTTLSIVLHEVPQEISEFLVLKKSGYSNREAILRNFASALSIFIGIAIGVFLIQSEILQAFLLGITATFFLGIVFTDLFPIRTIFRKNEFKQMFSALLVGVLIMFGLTRLLGHSHDYHQANEVHDDHNEDHKDVHDDHSHN